MLAELAETEDNLYNNSVIEKTQISIVFHAMLLWSFTVHIISNILNMMLNII